MLDFNPNNIQIYLKWVLVYVWKLMFDSHGSKTHSDFEIAQLKAFSFLLLKKYKKIRSD
jgi:hypothetical protein